MVEWRVVQEEESGRSRPSPPDGPARRGYLRPLLMLLLLVALALLLARREQTARLTRMEEDLRQWVLEEERARVAGRVEESNLFLSRDAPHHWRQHYERTFERAAEPIPIEVTEVAWHEDGALVTIDRGALPHYRYYRVESGRWRRAPIPDALLGASTTVVLPEGLRLSYQAIDLPFAETLVADLPRLTDEITGWGIDPVLTEIEIRPEENNMTPVARRRGVLVVASPSLYLGPIESGGTVTGTLRLALAERLLPDGEGRPPSAALLRHADRMYAAAREVQRHRWALTPEQLEERRTAWLQQLGEDWDSPFLSPWEPFGTPSRIVADYIYEVYGSDRLTKLLRSAHDRQTWNSLLLDELGVRAYHLEAEALAWVRGDQSALAELVRQRPGAALPNPPFVSRRIEPLGDETLVATAPGVPGRVLMDLSAARLEAADGSPLSTACAALFPELHVEGRWSVPGELLTVDRIRPTQSLNPFPASSTAPAFAAELSVVENPDHTGAAGPWSLLRFSSAADSVDVVEHDPRLLPEAHRLQALPDGRFLARLFAQPCEQDWLLLLDDRMRVVSGWRLEQEAWNTGSALFARPESGDYLFVSHAAEGNALTYLAVLDPDQPGAVSRMGPAKRPERASAVGWSDALDALIFVEVAGSGVVSALSLDGQERPLWGGAERPAIAAWQAVLSRDGRTLYMIAGASKSLLPDRLVALDLVTQESRTLLTLDEQRLFLTAPPIALNEENGTRLLLPALDLKTDQRQLLLVETTGGGPPRLVRSEHGGVEIPSTLLCGDGRVIFNTVDSTAQARDEPGAARNASRLWEWRPNGRLTELYVTSGTLTPLDCR